MAISGQELELAILSHIKTASNDRLFDLEYEIVKELAKRRNIKRRKK